MVKPPFSPIQIPGLPRRPISNVQPFTYRDSFTYLELIEKLRTWIMCCLVPKINEALDEMNDIQEEWDNQFNQLVIEINNVINQLMGEYTVNPIEYVYLTDGIDFYIPENWNANQMGIWVFRQNEVGNNWVNFPDWVYNDGFVNTQPHSVTVIMGIPTIKDGKVIWQTYGGLNLKVSVFDFGMNGRDNNWPWNGERTMYQRLGDALKFIQNIRNYVHNITEDDCSNYGEIVFPAGRYTFEAESMSEVPDVISHIVFRGEIGSQVVTPSNGKYPLVKDTSASMCGMAGLPKKNVTFDNIGPGNTICTLNGETYLGIFHKTRNVVVRNSNNVMDSNTINSLRVGLIGDANLDVYGNHIKVNTIAVSSLRYNAENTNSLSRMPVECMVFDGSEPRIRIHDNPGIFSVYMLCNTEWATELNHKGLIVSNSGLHDEQGYSYADISGANVDIDKTGVLYSVIRGVANIVLNDYNNIEPQFTGPAKKADNISIKNSVLNLSQGDYLSEYTTASLLLKDCAFISSPVLDGYINNITIIGCTGLYSGYEHMVVGVFRFEDNDLNVYSNIFSQVYGNTNCLVYSRNNRLIGSGNFNSKALFSLDGGGVLDLEGDRCTGFGNRLLIESINTVQSSISVRNCTYSIVNNDRVDLPPVIVVDQVGEKDGVSVLFLTNNRISARPALNNPFIDVKMFDGPGSSQSTIIGNSFLTANDVAQVYPAMVFTGDNHIISNNVFNDRSKPADVVDTDMFIGGNTETWSL